MSKSLQHYSPPILTHFGVAIDLFRGGLFLSYPKMKCARFRVAGLKCQILCVQYIFIFFSLSANFQRFNPANRNIFYKPLINNTL